MKNTLSLILFALFVISCNGRKANYSLDKTQPIVDYNQSYQYYDRYKTYNNAIQRYNDQTQILFHTKIINEKKLKQLIRKGKVRSVENITDEEKITEIGYNYDKVKRLIIAKRK